MRQAYDSMRATAIEGMALVEALIDFGEDEGISEGVFDQGTFQSARNVKSMSNSHEIRILQQLEKRSLLCGIRSQSISMTVEEARSSVQEFISPSSVLRIKARVLS